MSPSEQQAGAVVLTDAAASALRGEFLHWQCRLRQISARQAGGRPTEGMRPRVLSPSGEELSTGVVVLMVERDPVNNTAMMNFQHHKTMDPIERYDKILEFLSAGYFQHPENFSDVLTALFGAEHSLPSTLLHHGHCVLEFEQFSQAYRLPCTVTELAKDHPSFQATYWHNAMFNPNMPPDVRILAFAPDWHHSASWRVEME